MDENALPRATKVEPAGHWPAAEARDTLTLDYDDRHRRRRRYTAEGGLAFLLDLPEAAVLRDGDGLALEGGGYVLVRAASEPLVEVTAEAPAQLARLAWHLGNRHLPARIEAGRLLIRDDHVIVDMLRRLGAAVRRVSEPFDPEGGAYGEHNRQPSHPHGHHDHHHH
jgi:urease accessory protein